MISERDRIMATTLIVIVMCILCFVLGYQVGKLVGIAKTLEQKSKDNYGSD